MIAIRGFVRGKLVFEERIDEETMDPVALAVRHAERLMDDPHMIEIEMLDDPDAPFRFCRIGTDPRGMVLPLAFEL